MMGLIEELRKGGWEVGLHSLGDSRLDEEMASLSSIGVYPASARIHRLSMTVSAAWRRMAASGIQADCFR